MGNAAPGVGSGLDIKTLVNTLVSAEIAPKKNNLEKRGLSINTNLSALGQVKAVLSKLKDSLSNLSSVEKIFTVRSNLSDNDHFSVTGSAKATTGTHTIQVNQLAQKHSLTSKIFPNTTTSTAAGKIKIEFGTYSANDTVFTPNTDLQTLNFDIADEHSSLQEIADQINARKSNVQASIVQDSQGYRLSLTSISTGEKFAMKITATRPDGVYDENNALSALNYDPTLTDRKKMTQSVEAKNSRVTINNIEVLNNSNTLRDAISGLTIDLKNQHETGKSTTLILENDKVGLTTNLREFVKQYNDSISLLNTLTKTGKDVKDRGNMASDGGLKNIKFKLNSWATDQLENINSSVQTLSTMGLKLDAKGQMVLDETKLQKAMDGSFSDVGNFLAEKKPVSASHFDGVILKLEKMLKNWTDPSGELDSRTKQQESYMKKLNTEYEALEIRIENLQKRYFNQYNALDALLAKMQGITNNLAMQLNNSPNK